MIAAKASSLGANTVRSGVVSTVSTRPAVVRAPTSWVRPAAVAVSDVFAGMVKTSLTMWATPPSNLTSYILMSLRNLRSFYLTHSCRNCRLLQETGGKHYAAVLGLCSYPLTSSDQRVLRAGEQGRHKHWSRAASDGRRLVDASNHVAILINPLSQIKQTAPLTR